MGFAAIDARGRRVGLSKSLAELQARFAERARSSVAKVAETVTPGRDLERSGITAWDLGELPKLVQAEFRISPTLPGIRLFADDIFCTRFRPVPAPFPPRHGQSGAHIQQLHPGGDRTQASEKTRKRMKGGQTNP